MLQFQSLAGNHCQRKKSIQTNVSSLWLSTVKGLSSEYIHDWNEIILLIQLFAKISWYVRKETLKKRCFHVTYILWQTTYDDLKEIEHLSPMTALCTPSC